MDTALLIVAALYAGAAVFGSALEFLNIAFLRARGACAPPGLEGRFERGALEAARSYSVENGRLAALSNLFERGAALVFFLFLLVPYDRWVDSLGLSFVASGLLFFAPLLLAEALVNLPWSLYRTFSIEKRYSFSTITAGLWIKDGVKALALSALLGGALLAAALWIVLASPGLWWLWIWLLFLSFSVFMMYLSPYVIEPLFNRFEEVGDTHLKERLAPVMERAGIRVGRVMKVDSSRRTRHTNAYFTGMGRVKRIVLYDTLMELLDGDELAAVLAHEAGHWSKRHLLKTLVLMEAASLAALYISFKLVEGGALGSFLGMEGASFFANAALLGLVWPVAALPVVPFFAWLSRRHEMEADAFATALTGPRPLAGALIKLAGDNLANPWPHPLYAAYHYTHPPMAERIALLENGAKGQEAGSGAR